MRADFRLEDWIVRPLRDCIERGDEVVHIHPKPMAVLEALAKAGGEVVTREGLFQEAWPGVIVTDDALTQCIVELRKAFGDSAQDPRIIKTIPKVGFCIVPQVTFLDTLSPTGDEKSRLPEGKGYRSLFIRTMLAAVAVTLLVLAGLWFEDESGTPDAAAPVSIAVLPFIDLSEAGDQQWFTDGLSEELINMLARVDGLRVTNRTSSFHFRNPGEELRVIAGTLGVSHILEGSVRRDGGQLRVTAQLVDASSGYHVWSEAYDRELESVLALQRDISQAVVYALMESLGQTLGAVPGVFKTVSNEAHDAVLLGRHLVARRTVEDIEAAIQAFENALAAEPDYALAHAELAIAIRVLWSVGEGLSLSEARAWAAPHADEALALEPELAEAWAAVGLLQKTEEEQAKYYQQAIRLNPSYSIAYTWLGRILRGEGRYRESFELIETAIQVDPLSIPGIGNYVWDLVERGRLDDARRETEKLALLSPDMHVRTLAWLNSQGGKYSVFALGLLEAMSMNLDRRSTDRFLVAYLALMGLEQEALSTREKVYSETLHVLGKVDGALMKAQQRFDENPENKFRGRALGRALAAAGRYEQAKPYLEQAWLDNGRQVNRASLFRGMEAVALVQVYRATDEEGKATEVLDAMREYVNRLKEAGIAGTAHSISVDYLEGMTAYLSGQRETGLSLIGKAVENGAFIELSEAYLQVLYDDPGFVPIRAMQLDRQARERERFLAVVCNGNPYAEVWQPAEGTCAQFLARQDSR